MQQPVCIVIAARSSSTAGNGKETPARVVFRELPRGHRDEKFSALGAIHLLDSEWIECPSDWRAPFLPASSGAWATYPLLEELFVYNGAGVMPGRTWIIAPDAESLERRWKDLIAAPKDRKEVLFHPHLRNGLPGDKHSNKIVSEPLPGFTPRPKAVAEDKGPCNSPIPYGFRSFDRQWIIPDARLINQPNPELWGLHSEKQVYLTAFTEESPTSGPAVTFAGLIPDLHHYKGSFGGRAFPLWRDKSASIPNIRPKLLQYLSTKYGFAVEPEDVMAYIAAVAAHPSYTARFQDDLSTPGLRIPITAHPQNFRDAAKLGRTVLWLYTFGERMANAKEGRPIGPPRLPTGAPRHAAGAAAIPTSKDQMPDSLEYDAAKHRLHVGVGYIENVTPAMWSYEVSGKQVLAHWFSYRKKSRGRPIIGERRKPSPLGDIQPDHWLPEYTTELLNVLNVLGLLTELEPEQAELLNKICAGPLISNTELEAAGAFALPPKTKKTNKDKSGTIHMFEGETHDEVEAGEVKP